MTDRGQTGNRLGTDSGQTGDRQWTYRGEGGSGQTTGAVIAVIALLHGTLRKQITASYTNLATAAIDITRTLVVSVRRADYGYVCVIRVPV